MWLLVPTTAVKVEKASESLKLPFLSFGVVNGGHKTGKGEALAEEKF